MQRRILFITWLLILILSLSWQLSSVQAAGPEDDKATTYEDIPIEIEVLANDVDDRLDLVFANFYQKNRFCAGDGAGNFTCSDVSSDTFGHNAVAMGDMNGDGKLDAVFATTSRNRFCIGNGAGGFSCSYVSPYDPGDSYYSTDVALGDLNNDGKLDAVFANLSHRNRFCAGDGAGGFTCSDIATTEVRDSQGVVLEYLNNDSNLDALFANSQKNWFCIGNGSSFSTCINVNTDTNVSNDVALGELNSDTNLDAVFANLIPRNRYCTGNGAGGFACSDLSPDASPNSSTVALRDLNSDTKLDAIFATDHDTLRNRFCAGDGTGAFTCGDVSTDTNNSLDVVLEELTGDNKLDAVFANQWTQKNRLCAGDGAGSFTCSNVSADENSSTGVAVGYIGIDTNTLAVPVSPPNGQALVNPGGTIIYTPDPGFSHGIDTFTYTVESKTAIVTVWVGPKFLPLILK